MDASQRLEFLGYHFERHHGDYRFSSHPRLAEIVTLYFGNRSA